MERTRDVEDRRQELGRIADLHAKARWYAEHDPEVALAVIRKTAEAVCRFLFAETVGEPGKIMLDQMIQKLGAAGTLPSHVAVQVGTVRDLGNFGAHAQSGFNRFDKAFAAPALLALETVMAWFRDERLARDGDDARALDGGPRPAGRSAPRGAAGRGVGAPTTAVDVLATLPVRATPRRMVACGETHWIGLDDGTWCAITPDGAVEGPSDRLGHVSTVVARDRDLVVCSYEGAVATWTSRGWTVRQRLQPVLASAVAGDRLVLGDARGELLVEGAGDALPLAPGPVVDLRSQDDRLAVLSQGGAVSLLAWPPTRDARLVPVPLPDVRSPWAFFGADVPFHLGVVGAERLALVHTGTAATTGLSQRIDAGIAAAVPVALDGNPGFAVLTDDGAVLLLGDDLLVRAQLRLMTERDAVAIARAGEALLVRTDAGALYAVRGEDDVLRLAGGHVLLAAPSADGAHVVALSREGDGAPLVARRYRLP